MLLNNPQQLILHKIKIRKYLIILLAFGCFFRSEIKAQNKLSDNFYVSLKYQHGFVIPEYQNFLYTVNKPVNSFAFSILKKTIGTDDWEQLYNFPHYGVTFFYSTLGNNDVFGKEFAIYPHFNLDIIRKEKFSLYNQIGVGVGYISKKFDLVDNYKNVVVGSHFNIHFNTCLGIRYNISSRIIFNTGFSFDHFSNGNTHEPNIGINSVTFYSGFNVPIGRNVDIVRHDIQSYSKNNPFKIFYSIGGKHARALDSHFYLTSSLSVEKKWSVSRVFYIGAGSDLFYDSSTKSEWSMMESSAFNNRYNFRSGIHFSQRIVYNRLSLELQEGIYLFLTDKVNHNVMYNRGIIGFQVSKLFSVRVAMKSHLHILDFPELGLGIKL